MIAGIPWARHADTRAMTGILRRGTRISMAFDELSQVDQHTGQRVWSRRPRVFVRNIFSSAGWRAGHVLRGPCGAAELALAEQTPGASKVQDIAAPRTSCQLRAAAVLALD